MTIVTLSHENVYNSNGETNKYIYVNVVKTKNTRKIILSKKERIKNGRSRTKRNKK